MPPIEIPRGGLISKTAEIEVDASLNSSFNFIAAEESLSKFLKQYGPIHAFARSEVHKGPWSMPGALRTLYFDNGDTLREELLVFDPQHYFAYSISEFSGFAKHLSSIAYGEFAFQEKGNKTRVRWTYSFKPKNVLTALVVKIFLNVYFQKYMQQSLQLAKLEIEKEVS